MYKQILAFFLSFMLIFSSTSALAASPKGWTATAADTIMAGATATITAFKGAGSSAMKATIAHRPTAVAVGKELVKGGGALALAYAMSKLVDAGVDWVLDPENNRVKYTPTAADGSVEGTCSGSGWYAYGAEDRIGYFSSGSAACSAYASISSTATNPNPSFNSSNNRCYYTGGSKVLSKSGTCDASDPTFQPTEGEQYIPIETVAQEVIEGAEAAHPASQDFVRDVALGEVESGKLDTPLEAVAEPTTDTANPDAPTDPTDPSQPFDPSGIMDLLKRILGALGLLSLLGAISDNIASIADFFKSEPQPDEDTELEIPEPPLPEPDTDISFGGSCPSDLGTSVNLYGNSFEFVLMPFSKVCPLLSTFVKPTLILLGSFMAITIVGGRKET